jgi:hypothetical protein
MRRALDGGLDGVLLTGGSGGAIHDMGNMGVLAAGKRLPSSIFEFLFGGGGNEQACHFVGEEFEKKSS